MLCMQEQQWTAEGQSAWGRPGFDLCGAHEVDGRHLRWHRAGQALLPRVSFKQGESGKPPARMLLWAVLVCQLLHTQSSCS